MIMLGIDPGFRFAGFALLKKDLGKVFLLDAGYLPMSSKKTLSERVGIFFHFFDQKVKDYHVTNLALETPFLGKNAQNFLKLGYLRGILYLLADQYNLQLHEFSPREVKQAVTGYGGAPKDQVARVVLQLFPRIKHPKKEDVTDALAVSLCGLWRSNITNHLRK